MFLKTEPILYQGTGKTIFPWTRRWRSSVMIRVLHFLLILLHSLSLGMSWDLLKHTPPAKGIAFLIGHNKWIIISHKHRGVLFGLQPMGLQGVDITAIEYINVKKGIHRFGCGKWRYSDVTWVSALNICVREQRVLPEWAELVASGFRE